MILLPSGVINDDDDDDDDDRAGPPRPWDNLLQRETADFTATDLHSAVDNSSDLYPVEYKVLSVMRQRLYSLQNLLQ